MIDKFEMSTGQAHELAMALGRNGFSNEQVKRLSEGDILTEVRSVIEGRAAIIAVEHVIDLDANPYLPDGWKVEEHQKGGQLVWDASKVNLFLSDGQKNGKVIEGNKLRKELAKQPTLNANVGVTPFLRTTLLGEWS